MTDFKNPMTYSEKTQQRLGDNDFGVLLPRSKPKTLHWAVPLSDLMMTMFVFFAVLYFYQINNGPSLSGEGSHSTFPPSAQSKSAVQQADTGTAVPGTVHESMSGLYDFSKKTMAAKDLKDFASVDLVPDKAVRIILTGDLLFDTGRAQIKEMAKAALREVAEIIRATPYMVNVVGHTDDVPIQSKQFPTNWELSVTRASQVARFLIEEMNISGDRFFVTGHAYYQPVKANISDLNRAANRRVEIIITKERPGETGQDVEAKSSQYDRWPWNTF